MLSLHDALTIWRTPSRGRAAPARGRATSRESPRSFEDLHQSPFVTIPDRVDPDGFVDEIENVDQQDSSGRIEVHPGCARCRGDDDGQYRDRMRPPLNSRH